ncbi:ACT domain-containing protein [Haloechinothrix sp. YIM 98757]|uniref:ACT domain-containing protein n=1 Tax=Haloechinothrix aidingensis TaxID=2752311 RepID=A0A838ACE4_9PSEU|nr:ACT domain-containing protein [Haloechinothrix aidingensis]MBA0126910.1 ACT domain-containing protein [Haloechinothrix aidingensis]
MATDLTVYLDDHPGELARVGELLGSHGVNIEGVCTAAAGGGQAEVHVLVEDMATACTALDSGRVPIAADQEVVVVPVADRPGVLGDITRELGKANVNITLAYLATNTRLVLGADDLAEAKSVLSSFMVPPRG